MKAQDRDLDPAVAELLQLDPTSKTTVSASGHGTSSATTAKIAVELPDGSVARYFMKTLAGKDGPLLVEGKC